MSSDSKKSRVISLSVSKFAVLGANLIAGMVFSRKLPIDEYGTYLQTFLSYDLAVPILTLGIPSSIYYFLADTKENSKKLVLECLLVLLFSSFLFIVFIFLGGTVLMAKRFNNEELIETLYLISFYPVFTFPVLLASSVWVSVGKVKFNAIFSFISGLLLAVFLISSVYYSESYYLAIVSRVLLSFILFPFSIYYLFKFLPGNWSFPSLKSMLEIIKFSTPIGLASILGTLTIQFSGLIVSLLTSPEEFAIYSNGAKEIPFIGIITGSISVVILAEMAKEIKQLNYYNALLLFRKSAYLSSCFLFPIMFFLFIFSEYFITFLYSENYLASVNPFRIYLLIVPARIAYYGSAFIALGKSNLILTRSIFDLTINALLCAILTKLFGIEGAAASLVFTVYFWSIPYNIFSLSKLFNVPFLNILPYRKLLLVLFSSICATIISSLSLLLPIKYIYQFLIGLLVFVSIYIFIMSLLFTDIKRVVMSYIKNYARVS